MPEPIFFDSHLDRFRNYLHFGMLDKPYSKKKGRDIGHNSQIFQKIKFHIFWIPRLSINDHKTPSCTN